MSASLDSVGVLDGSTYVTARAWVSWIGGGGSIRASYNVSSVTFRTTGRYTVNLASAVADANWVVDGLNGTNGTGGGTIHSLKIDDPAVTPTSSAIPIASVGSAYYNNDCSIVLYR